MSCIGALDTKQDMKQELNTEFLKSLKSSLIGGTTQETNITKSLPDKMVDLMKAEPNITAKQIAERLNISFDGVRYHIKNLRANGRIKREGSTKSGKWIVIK